MSVPLWCVVALSVQPLLIYTLLTVVRTAYDWRMKIASYYPTSSLHTCRPGNAVIVIGVSSPRIQKCGIRPTYSQYLLFWAFSPSFAAKVAPPKLHLVWVFFRGRPQLVGTFRSKISIFPSFIVKIGQERPHQKGGGFHVSKFLLLPSFCLLLP